MKNADLRDVLTDAMIGTICSAARKLTGFGRRQFQAEVAIQYCEGSARKAERIFGWSRMTVSTGLCEKRTGMRCADAFRLRGRKKSKVAVPQLTVESCCNADSGTPADSTLQAVLAEIGLPDVQVEAKLKSIDPQPTEDSGQGSSGLIIHRVGSSLKRALKNRRMEQ